MGMRVVLVGTGTSVGKTHVAERVLRVCGAEGIRAAGYKPVESGISTGDAPSDGSRLHRAESFHVKPALSRQVFTKPVSPHIAAREAHVHIDVNTIVREIVRGAELVDILVIELPGGAFSPLTESALALDVVRAIPHAYPIAVAPDRLGVIHDVVAVARASAAAGTPLRGVILSAPATPDESTGTNAQEIPTFTRLRILASLPRLPALAPVSATDPLRPVVRELLSESRN